MDNFRIIDHSTAVLNILFNDSKLVLSLIILLFCLSTNNNSLALQALSDSRPYKSTDSKVLQIYSNA